LAKPNYSFAKRQREIAKKQKKEEKRLRKAGPEEGAPAPAESDTQHEVVAPPAPDEKPIP
jgi:hypothetical protein